MPHPPHRTPRAPLAALLLLCAACGGDARATAGAWAGTVDTLPNGAVRVSSPEEGLWKPGEEWRLVEELRIGSAEVDGPELFGNVTALEVDPLGRIYVLDSQARELRVFGADGSHVRTVGRDGAGPGEFRNPAALAWDPQGHLWVVDQQNARYSVFDTTGAYLTSHRRKNSLSTYPWPGGIDVQGRVYDVALLPGEDFRTRLVRLDAEMEPADTLRIPHYDAASFRLVDPKGRSRMSAAVPFAPSQASRLDPEGYVWAGVTDRYRLHRITFAGDTTRIVERRFTPVPVSTKEREDALEGLEWFTKQGGKLDASRVPGEKPAFSGLRVDDRGYLWVWPQVAEGVEGSVIDVFDRDGRYLGALRTPEQIGSYLPFLVRGDRLYTVVPDELEVPYVVRFRIEGRTTEG